MKHVLYFFLIISVAFSCKESANTPQPEAQQEEMTATPEQDLTDPKTTEVWEPEPKVVSFNAEQLPSDAIVLFDGTDLGAWVSSKDSMAAGWKINEDGTMTVVAGTGDIETRQHFGSVQLHLEWSAPDIVEGEGQGRGNSGVFLQNRYEVQILDSYQNRTYSNGQAASVYKQHIPLVNATKSPEEWQTYDIIFHAPEFDAGGKKTKSGTLTVLHNGVLVQDHVEILGTTEYIGLPKNEAHGKGPIRLQDHGNPMQFRNIWVRPL